MYGLARKVLFRMDPEQAHGVAMAYLRRVHRSSMLRERQRRKAGEPDPRLAVDAFGLSFPGPLGLAAGFDKGARVYNALLAAGFSHVEVGTVTPKAQKGNPKPRLERYPDHGALVNRMGFNNPGLAAVADRLERFPPEGILGANVGKNKATPPERAVDDYVAGATALGPLASYVTVNVSSPNTPGLRALQEPDKLGELIGRVLEAVDDAGAAGRPVLLKLHPDASDEALVAAARAAVDAGAAGIIAVNTTTQRPAGLDEAGPGGLSGTPLHARAVEVVGALHDGLGRDVPIVGAGGIRTGADALALVEAGASLLQAYTGYIYRGPRFPSLVHREMSGLLAERGVDRLGELVGTGSPLLRRG